MDIFNVQKILSEALIEAKFTSISKIDISSKSSTSISVHGLTDIETQEEIFEIINKRFKLSYISFDKETMGYVSDDQNDDDENQLPDQYKSLGYSHLYFSFKDVNDVLTSL